MQTRQQVNIFKRCGAPLLLSSLLLVDPGVGVSSWPLDLLIAMACSLPLCR